MVRKFRLMNEKGEDFDFMDFENFAFLSSPTGLGYSSTATFYQVGDNYVVDNRKLNQSTIGGVLMFKTYDNFKKLIDFIEQSEKIRFYYSIPTKYGYEEFYKEVVIEEISKTQKTINGVLECNLTMKGKNKWLKEEIIITKERTNTKDSRWEFTWNPTLIEYNNNLIVYNNVSNSEAGFIIEIGGEVLNPSIIIEDKDGEELVNLKYKGKLNSEQKLTYSTIDTDLKYQLSTGDDIRNLFNELSLENANFKKLVKGVNKIKLHADTNLNKVVIKIYPEFKSV